MRHELQQNRRQKTNKIKEIWNRKHANRFDRNAQSTLAFKWMKTIKEISTKLPCYLLRHAINLSLPLDQQIIVTSNPVDDPYPTPQPSSLSLKMMPHGALPNLPIITKPQPDWHS